PCKGGIKIVPRIEALTWTRSRIQSASLVRNGSILSRSIGRGKRRALSSARTRPY
ncbi:unnamed protein product, partial [Choristocarpus tenellus]